MDANLEDPIAGLQRIFQNLLAVPHLPLVAQRPRKIERYFIMVLGLTRQDLCRDTMHLLYYRVLLTCCCCSGSKKKFVGCRRWRSGRKPFPQQSSQHISRCHSVGLVVGFHLAGMKDLSPKQCQSRIACFLQSPVQYSTVLSQAGHHSLLLLVAMRNAF